MRTLAAGLKRRAAGMTAMSLGLMILSSVIGASATSAADYPTRPIRIVVGFTAGGPTDVPIRFIADRLSKAVGQPVIVEDKPGAGSMLATQEVLSHPRDGYNLLACTYFDPVNTLLYKKAQYKVSDIAPVTLISKYDYAIAVSKNILAKNFGEFVQYAMPSPRRPRLPRPKPRPPRRACRVEGRRRQPVRLSRRRPSRRRVVARQPNGKRRWAAKQEGKVVVAGGPVTCTGPRPPRSRSRIRTSRSSTPGAVDRISDPKILAERDGGQYLWDVHQGGATPMVCPRSSRRVFGICSNRFFFCPRCWTAASGWVDWIQTLWIKNTSTCTPLQGTCCPRRSPTAG